MYEPAPGQNVSYGEWQPYDTVTFKFHTVVYCLLNEVFIVAKETEVE